MFVVSGLDQFSVLLGGDLGSSPAPKAPMASFWVKCAQAASWLCEPKFSPANCEPPPAILEEEMVNVAQQSSMGQTQTKLILEEEPKEQLQAARQTEAELLSELLKDRMKMANKVKALQEQVGELSDVLEETRARLVQEEKASEGLRAQLCQQEDAGEARSVERELLGALLSNRLQISHSDQSLQSTIEEQRKEIEQLRDELRSAQAMLVNEQAATQELRVQMQQEREIIHAPSAQKMLTVETETAQDATTELLSALLEHTSSATSKREQIQEQIAELRQEVKTLQVELEAAEAVAQNEKSAADELREKLQEQENFYFELERINCFQTQQSISLHFREKVYLQFYELLRKKYPCVVEHVQILMKQSSIGAEATKHQCL